MAVAALSGSDWTRAGRTWLGALGVLVVAGSLLWTLGPVGLLLGGLVGLLWLTLPGPYAVAAGHVVLLPVVPDPGLSLLVGLEAGFLAVLAAPFVREPDWFEPVVAIALAGPVLAAIAWTGWASWEPRWLAGLVLLVLVALGLYGIHRYSVLTLELQGVEPRA